MGGSSGKTETNTDPWSGQQPYLTDLMQQGQHLFDEGVGLNYYPGSTVAPFSDPTMQGFDMFMSRAGGTPGQYGMGDYLTSSMATPGTDPLAYTAYGGYLGSNPYLDAVYDKGAGDIVDRFQNEMLPGLNATFGAGDRQGSLIQAEMMADLAGETMDSLSGLYGGLYAPAYESERDRMMSAAGGLSDQAFRAATLYPSYDTLERQNIGDVMTVGGALDSRTQALMDADKARYDYGNMAPWNMLNNYANVVYGLPGGYGTTTAEQPRGSPIAGGIGGAMAGAGLAGSVASLNPYMMPLTIAGGVAGML